MSPIITPEMRQAIQEHEHEPVEVRDTETNRVYVLVDKNHFERLQAMVAEGEFSPSEFYPLIAQTAAEAGWADPAMDVYDDYDKHRSQGAAG